MGDIVSAQRDNTEDTESQAQDSDAEDKTVDDKEALLEYVEIDDRTDSDPEADEEELNENEDRMNEINRGFRKFFSNIGLRLNVKQETDDKQAETASDEPVMPDAEEEPSYLGDTCDMANESASETAENNADLHVALDSADNESTTCPTKDMMEMAEESKGKADAEVKSPEEGGFTDVQEDMIETAEESKGKVESEVNLPEEGGVTDVQEDMIELGEESKDKVEAEVKSPDKGGVADVQEGMIETAEESKGEVDAAVKTTEEVEVTDANKAIDICCKDEHEVVTPRKEGEPTIKME
ncbi:hypothetical protein NHX12_019344, partial [Muraenolepis orangiensis]